MFLDSERTWVQGVAKDFPFGEDERHTPPDGKRNQLSDKIADGDTGVPEEEELVKAGDNNSHNHTQEPYTDGGHRHVWVIRVGDSRTDLRVRTVLLEVAQMIPVEIRVREMGSGNLLDGGIIDRGVLDVVLLVVRAIVALGLDVCHAEEQARGE